MYTSFGRLKAARKAPRTAPPTPKNPANSPEKSPRKEPYRLSSAMTNRASGKDTEHTE